jgi:ammonium transporter Rh
LHDYLKRRIGLHDTAGVHNLHGIPGLLGGLISGVAVAVYNSDPLTNSDQVNYLGFYSSPFKGRTFIEQGAIQVAGTGVSLGMGILFGVLAGYLISLFYSTYSASEFYNDHYHFEQVGLLHEVGPKSVSLVQQPTEIVLNGQQNTQRN